MDGNYYRLTKKELSFITRIQKPVLGSDGKRISIPVVVVSNRLDNVVLRVYTIRWYKKIVKENCIYPSLYNYEICSML